MGKKEFPKKETNVEFEGKSGFGAPQIEKVKSKLTQLSDKLLALVKLILGLCLLVFVYASIIAFLNEFSLLDKPLQNYFWAGIIGFLGIYLFVFEPAAIYRKGQKILEAVFKFFAPLVKVAPYVLPVYSIIIFFLYWAASLVIKSYNLLIYFMFFMGFSLALHLVFSAKSLRTKQGDFLKSNYIFGLSFVLVLNIMLTGMFLNIIFDKFSFINFSNVAFGVCRGILSAAFRQLFVT